MSLVKGQSNVSQSNVTQPGRELPAWLKSMQVRRNTSNTSNTQREYISVNTSNIPPPNPPPPGSDYAYYQEAAAELYNELKSGVGRVKIGDDNNVLDKINTFLSTYPQRNIKKNATGAITPNTWVDMSVRDLFQQTIQIIIEIINELSDTISDRQLMSSTDYRRKLFDIFVRPERRLYVGLILVFFSFILYFIDSAT